MEEQQNEQITLNESEKALEPELVTESFTVPKKKKKGWFMRFFFYPIIFVVVSFFIFSSTILISGTDSDSWFARLPIISQVKHLVESADKDMKGLDRGRINILLLGMGGENHDGGYLTDTIIILSIEPKTKKVSMVSVPRDLTIPIEDMGWRKINNVNAFAEKKEKGSGGKAISQALGDLLETPIDYYVRVDFQGFINIVDALGGIDVYVDNVLEDYRYPVMGQADNDNYNARYEHLYVEKGWQHMDGSLSLKYSRSRHGVGTEGSDFARAKRQQKVIAAAKDKLLSKNTILQPGILTKIIGELGAHVSTNLKVWEIVELWRITKDINANNIINKVLDDSPQGLLVSGRGDEGAYILTPRSGDFQEIKYLVQNIFSETSGSEKTEIITENASVEIRNGTWKNGLAQQRAVDLEKYGFTITNIANSKERNVPRSIIYDLSYGEKINSLKILKEKTGAKVSFELPAWLVEEIGQDVAKANQKIKRPDFILILGGDEKEADSSGQIYEKK